ncbi:hypothetical protein SmJEL517_g05142 [Synchytrium microbalum]|uniref:P/Homo B domain-containing protein n=1 Tax=Synchytrium microbalum TaxID=1806994 RepID=A0A507BQV1_9FUNG|nr:uncharacterized protein SmJEL517_g05142 [Synchytrium microbalum]TPX31557.1 hypothetical protein SmJEL517_g05142 [Synchytrium microbalum]
MRLNAVWIGAWVLIFIHSSVNAADFPILDHDNYYYHAIEVHSESGSDDDHEELYRSKAKQVALHSGCTLLTRIGELPRHYLLSMPKGKEHVWSSAEASTNHRIRRQEQQQIHMEEITDTLIQHPHVSWAQEQIPRRRYKRSGGLLDTSAPSPELAMFENVTDRLAIHDPGLANQWHLFNRDQLSNDINISPVWDEGISGNGSVVCVLDDGLDYEHDDLKANFNAAGSYDFNDNEPLPTPKLGDDRHGTRIAGEIAAVRNNMCGIGVAYNAQISGVRILSADLTEAQEAAAVNYAMNVNDIYSCSWGPSDDGRTVDGPGPLVAAAFQQAIEKGRKGLGSLYVFASGNGGGAHDTCNFDGYANSPYSITVAAIDRTNGHPAYSEACTAVLVSMYSSGAGSFIYTTDKGNGQCSGSHGGTSAAAPIVSGVLALVLEIRPDLTWRDVQYLIVNAATPFNLTYPDWQPSYHPDRKYATKFGFGKLDANRIVQMAKTWKNVGPNTILTSPVSWIELNLPQDQAGVSNTITIDDALIKEAGLLRIEHVQVVVSISHSKRGEVEAKLTSPNKIVSYLAERRSGDVSNAGFKNWTFMTVKHWDEPPLGQWTLTVIDQVNPANTGIWHSWYLKLWGEHINSSSTILPSPTSTSIPSLFGATPTSTIEPITSPISDKPITSPSSSSISGWVLAAFSILVIGLIGWAGVAIWKRRHRWITRNGGSGGIVGNSDSYEFKILNDEDEELEAVFGEDGHDEDDEEEFHHAGFDGSSKFIPYIVPYAVIPSFTGWPCNVGLSCTAASGGLDPFQATTLTLSHELAEMFTDTFVNLNTTKPGFFVDTPGTYQGQEIGDICQNYAVKSATADGGKLLNLVLVSFRGEPNTVLVGIARSYVMTKLWSNSANACVPA